ncbi:MAG: RIP metalloprotease RseP [Bacilli bacterium]
METVLGILAFIFILGLIISIHEAGHFFFASRAGVLCREYAIGMGPEIFKKRKGETLYKLKLFPIGGYCAIAGEEVEEDMLQGVEKVKLGIKGGEITDIYLNIDNENDDKVYNLIEYDIFDLEQTGKLFMKVEKDGIVKKYAVNSQAFIHDKKLHMQIAPFNRTLGSKSLGKRALVMFGGPMFNFILAFLVFIIVGLSVGYIDYNNNQLSQVEKDGPAYRAGLQADDYITELSVDDFIVVVDNEGSWDDIEDFFLGYIERESIEPARITYLRDGVEHISSINPMFIIYNMGLYSDATKEDVIIKDIDYSETELMNNVGLKVNDKIIKINNKDIIAWSQVAKIANEYIGNSNVDEENILSFVVLRDGIEETVEIKPYSKSVMDSQKDNTGKVIPNADVILGVTPIVKHSFFESVSFSINKTVNSTTLVFDTLGMLFKNQITIRSLSGFVGIADMTIKITAGGIVNLLSWLGLLSVNIGLMNLLPIPALDGGRLVFLGYEAITRKKPNRKVETALISITFILLMGLIVFVTINDILRLI